MHRSGTSALARLLNLCGADLGRDLLPAKQDNERGFWENSVLLNLHEKFLGESGLHWHGLCSLPSDWRNLAPARHFIAALPDILAQQFGGSRLIAVKDPRLALLAPLWIEVLQGLGIRPVFVVTVRHPDEVAASLAARDGFAYAQSRLLWLQHLLDAERATRHHARCFVHYERLLANWRVELARISDTLEIPWPTRNADADRRIDDFIAPSLRHNRSDSRDSMESPLPNLVRNAYALAAAATSAAPAIKDFDALAAEFDSILQLTSPWIDELSRRLEQHQQQHAREIDLARSTVDSKDWEIAQARGSIDTLSAELDQARQAHEKRDRVESDLRHALNAQAAEIEHARRVYALKEQEVESARHNIDGLVIELARAREAFAAQEEELDATQRQAQAFSDELAVAGEAFATKDREVDAARRNIDDLVAQIDRARDGFATREAEVAVARGNIDALVAEIDRARLAHATRDASEAALRDEIASLRQSRWFRLGHALHLLGRPQR